MKRLSDQCAPYMAHGKCQVSLSFLCQTEESSKTGREMARGHRGWIERAPSGSIWNQQHIKREWEGKYELKRSNVTMPWVYSDTQGGVRERQGKSEFTLVNLEDTLWKGTLWGVVWHHSWEDVNPYSPQAENWWQTKRTTTVFTTWWTNEFTQGEGLEVQRQPHHGGWHKNWSPGTLCVTRRQLHGSQSSLSSP